MSRLKRICGLVFAAALLCAALHARADPDTENPPAQQAPPADSDFQTPKVPDEDVEAPVEEPPPGGKPILGPDEAERIREEVRRRMEEMRNKPWAVGPDGELTAAGERAMKVGQNLLGMDPALLPQAYESWQSMRRLMMDRRMGNLSPDEFDQRFRESWTSLSESGLLEGVSATADDVLNEMRERWQGGGHPGGPPTDGPPQGRPTIPGGGYTPGIPGQPEGRPRSKPPPWQWETVRGVVGDSPVLEEKLAESYLEYGDPQKAIAAGMNAVAMDPSRAGPYATVGEAYRQLGDYSKAAEVARQGLAKAGMDSRLHSFYQSVKGRAGAGKDPSTQAASALPGAGRTVRPFDPGTLRRGPPRTADAARSVIAAKGFLRKGLYSSAADEALKAVRFNPDDPNARYVRLLALVKAKRFREGLKEAGEAIDLFPKEAMFRVVRANIHNSMKNGALALQDADEAIRLEPGNAEAHINRAWALDLLGGRREEMLASLRRAAQLNPKQYGGVLREAESLKDGELAAMLGGESLAEPQGEKGFFTPGMRTGLLIAGALAGGGLLAFGFFSALAGRKKEKLQEAFADVVEEREPPESLRPAPVSGDTIGTTIGGTYKVTRKIGLGGMGIVYEALDTSLERRVAVKKMREEIRADPHERERFLKEARTVASLHNPNIVDIYGIVEDGQDAYLIFEYVDGKTVHEILHARKKFTYDEALGVMRGAASALEYAHKRSIIHRDLKPSNIMIDTDRQVKVMDFGVARQAKDSISRMSMTNTVVGTPPYMAPEQEQGMVTAASDVYALAICFYEMLTGQLPFRGVGAGMLMAKMNKTYVPLSRVISSLPPGVDEVMGKALEPYPEKRWQTAGEFYEKLKALRNGR